jgi:hypothetical protein
MKQPELRETTNRDEMMCPRCETEGLKENPAYADEYSGRAALLKSTRCPNEECEYNYGVPESDIEVQLPDKNYTDGISDIIPTELTFGSVIRVSILFAGIFLVITQFGLLPSDSSNPTTDNVVSNISGNITGENLSELSNKSVQLNYMNDTEYRTIESINQDNNFEFEDVESGEYLLYLHSPDLNINPDGQQINVNESNIDNITINVADSQSYNFNQTVSDALIDIDYKNPHNIDDINFTLSPINGDNIEREHKIQSGTTRTILIPIKPQSEQIRVESKETRERQIVNSQYVSNEDTYNIYGNMNAESLNITLTNESSSEVQSETIVVPDSGITDTISVLSNETIGPVTVTLRNGTSQDRQQITEKWNGENNVTFFSGVKNTTTANLQINPEPQIDTDTISGTISGTISNTLLQPEFRGNMPINDAVIKFNGGDSDAEEIGSVNMESNAENGSTGEVIQELVTINESGTYRLNWDATISENPNLVNFSYIINGDSTVIPQGSDGEGLSLESGDTVEIMAESERETVSNDENSPHFGSLNENINVVDMRFSDNNPSAGDNIELFATVENTGSREVTEEFIFYLNGNEEASGSYTIPGNSQKEIGGINELGTTAISEEGTNVWFINDKGPFFLEVGDSEPVYGVGEISATIQDLSAEGEVRVDTTNDGETDCTVLASGGECSFEEYEFNPNTENNIRVEEVSVSNTDYTIEYTEQTNPRDVTVDMRENNINDYAHDDGVLTNADGTVVELVPGNMSMAISSENGVPLTYSLTWDAESVIDNPVVYVNNEEKISNLDSFQETKSFNLDPLPEGENTFEFLSSSGGYTVDIEWIEDEGQSYPTTIIDNNQECRSGGSYANNLTCTITGSGLSPGEHTIDFNSISNSFNYQLSYHSRAISSSVNVDVNGETKQFNRQSVNPTEWQDVATTSLLSRGNNNVTVSVPDANNMNPNSTATIQYSIDTGDVENPELIVTNGQGETNNVDIPSSALDSNLLTEDVDITIPSEWLTTNNNQIEVKTEDGIFEISGELRVKSENIKLDTN